MTEVDDVVGSGRIVRVGRRDIHCTEFGAGPAVLLLHGGGPGAAGLSNYSRNIEPLSKHFRVIVPDLPGYGGSSKDIDPLDPFGSLAEAIGGLLDELDLRSAHLVGNSYGGAGALRLAMDRPEKVGRMVLMGPGGVGTTRALPTAGLKQLLDYYPGSGPGRDKLTRFIRESLVYDDAEITDEIIEERYRASVDPEVIANPPLRRPSGPWALRTALRMDFTRDRARLARCTVPTLVIWGTADKVNRPSGARQLATRMPNCDVFLAAKTGHWVQFERAALFNELTTAFFGVPELEGRP